MAVNGLNNLLGIARSALAAQQVAIEQTGQNVANAQTEGYTRRRVMMSPAQPIMTPWGAVGTGVQVENIQRVNDIVVDATARRELGSSEYHSARTTALQELEGMFNEPSANGLGASMDAFFHSWSDLAQNPTSETARSVVRERGVTMAGMFNGMAGKIDELTRSLTVRLSVSIDQANALAGQIAEINGNIAAAEGGGHEAGDLRDRRDQLLDAFTKLTGATTTFDTKGNPQIVVGNNVMIDGPRMQPLSTAGTPPAMMVGVPPTPIGVIGGSIGGEVDVMTNAIPLMTQKLDALARGMVLSVNAVHTTGEVYPSNTPPGSPAPDFFDTVDPLDPTSITAKTIAVSGAVMGNVRNVAASLALTGPGNNDIATALGQGGRTAGAVEWPTGMYAPITDFYETTVSQLGLTVGTADSQAQAASALSLSASARRESVRGVNIDEEMVNLIKYQQAYQAAAKIVTTASDMADVLIAMVR